MGTVEQRVKALENERDLLWREARALRERLARGWKAALEAALGSHTVNGNITRADGDWTGLGVAKGRIEFNDETIDILKFVDCNIGISKFSGRMLTIPCYLLYSATTTILALSSYNQATMAIAHLKYVELYAYAGSAIQHGVITASTRRANNNTAWSDIDNRHIQSVSSGAGVSNPNLFWDNGILKVTMPTNVIGYGIITLAAWNVVVVVSV